MESPRWNIITHSQYEWERRGLDFIRSGLPDHDPYRAWANFEFQTNNGAIYEVDLLVLTKQGFWLVESKAWGGRIWGDTGTWTRSQDGKLRSEDSPVLLANRKAKALTSLLQSQPALSKIRLPWLDALVFLSADVFQHQERAKILRENWCEEALLGAMAGYLPFAKALGLEPPFWILAALVGCEGAKLWLNRAWEELSPHAIDRAVVFLPETKIDAFDTDPVTHLRPMLDVLWNAAGLERSFSYDEQGNRNPRQ